MTLKLFPLIAAIALSSCGAHRQASAETDAVQDTTPAQSLIALLDSVAGCGQFYFGHHDDTAYGHDWHYIDGKSDVKDVTGEYPGLMSWDLGMIEVDSSKNLDGVPFAFMADQIARQQARGGINAISWHPLNPSTGGGSWDVSKAPLRELTTNKALSDTLDVWIGRAADFIASLKDAQGNPIPVIFRPWHENSGSWFWWGAAPSQGPPPPFVLLSQTSGPRESTQLIKYISSTLYNMTFKNTINFLM